MIVFIGFCGAGYLINSSYSDWRDSPVATSITTHPISELDFTTVTVCPPKGSHTALNYDLMKADNDSLTEQDRLGLIEKAHEIFIKPSHLEYIETMIATGNPENIKQIYQGFQTTPKPYHGAGLEIIGWNSQGTFETPWFGQSFNKSYYNEDKIHHFVLELPTINGMTELVGSGSLVIQLEVDTREEEGWQEYVSYLEGPRLTLSGDSYGMDKSWEESEDSCQEKGSHLASIHSEWEQQEVVKLARFKQNVWVGGFNQANERVFLWSDGLPMQYSNWGNGQGKGESMGCVSINSLQYQKWTESYCENKRAFICQKNT